ncbi:MAG: hypothetical protein JNK85_09840 [Verrucomicrobiales bacterium]|nr:hypothetical protein [Verrucomicrobiales bacterium]
MIAELQFAPRTFAARVAELGFTTRLPRDWISHELPAEPVDFSDPTSFLPLAIVTAPHSAIVFAFAARPAHGDGTLHDWAWYHLNHNGLQPRAIGQDRVGGVPAMVGEALQASEMGPMVVRFAFLEDGNRLLNLSFTAPEILADAVRDAWFQMLASFTLETPRGSRFQSESGTAANPIAPVPEPSEESSAAEPATTPTDESTEAPNDLEALPNETGIDGEAGSELGNFALAHHAATLSQVPMVETGAGFDVSGLPPIVVETDDDGRRATVAARSIRAKFDVPYGWHVLDDTERVHIIDPGRQVWIRLELIHRDGGDDETLLDTFEAAARSEGAGIECERGDLGRIRILRVRPRSTEASARGVLEMLLPHDEGTWVLWAHVEAIASRLRSVERMVELILDNTVFDPLPPNEPAAEPSPAARDGKPEWWHQALALEVEDQLVAAETLIRERCPHIGFAHATAEMYRLRMGRLLAAGDRAAAREAFLKASAFIRYYASLATSGGEGLALSEERDQFRAVLVMEFGSDPEVPS